MVATPLYFLGQSDLEDALSVSIAVALLSDNNEQEVSASAVSAACAYGTSEVKTWLYGNYPVPTTAEMVTDDLKFAAVDFACAYAVRRRPDIAKAMGMIAWTEYRDAAIARMKRFLEGVQDLPPAPNDGTLSGGGPEVTSLPPRYCGDEPRGSDGFYNADD